MVNRGRRCNRGGRHSRVPSIRVSPALVLIIVDSSFEADSFAPFTLDQAGLVKGARGRKFRVSTHRPSERTSPPRLTRSNFFFFFASPCSFPLPTFATPSPPMNRRNPARHPYSPSPSPVAESPPPPPRPVPVPTPQGTPPMSLSSFSPGQVATLEGAYRRFGASYKAVSSDVRAALLSETGLDANEIKRWWMTRSICRPRLLFVATGVKLFQLCPRSLTTSILFGCLVQSTAGTTPAVSQRGLFCGRPRRHSPESNPPLPLLLLLLHPSPDFPPPTLPQALHLRPPRRPPRDLGAPAAPRGLVLLLLFLGERFRASSEEAQEADGRYALAAPCLRRRCCCEETRDDAET